MTTREDAKKFVIQTLNQGNPTRIKEVLKRYFAFIKTTKKDIVDEAREIFNA